MPTPLWSEIDGEPWLDNPRRKRRRRKAGSAKRRRHRRAAASGGVVAHRKRRRRRHTGFAINPRHHRRRGRRHAFRQNPFKMGGIMARAKEGVIGGTGVVVGKGISRAVPTLIGQSRTGVIGIVISGLAGIFLSPIAKKIGGADFGTGFLYGAFAAPIESFVVSLNVPVLSPALSSYADELAAIPYQPGALRGVPDGMGFTTLNPGFEDIEEQAVM